MVSGPLAEYPGAPCLLSAFTSKQQDIAFYKGAHKGATHALTVLTSPMTKDIMGIAPTRRGNATRYSLVQ